MINPVVIPRWLGAWLGTGEAGFALGKRLLGDLVYSLLVAYLVLRMLRLVQKAEGARLWPCMLLPMAVLAICSILRSGKAKGVRFGAINRICYYLQCDVGDILKFDGELEVDADEST